VKRALVVALFAACGGSSGSGVDGDLKVIDLTSSELDDECAYLFDTYPSKTVDCGGGDMTTIGETSVAECEASAPTEADAPDCDATVADTEDCLDYIYNNTCTTGGTEPASCSALFSTGCATTSSRKLFESIEHASVLSR
jgi:hypothetical protein